MSNTPAPNIYESTFAPSDKTDAILVVDGKKLHVSKGLLSYHSDYFKTLFNADFAEKSMPEIPIKNVNYEDFATLLSSIQEKPIPPTVSNAEEVLKLADRFLMLAAKNHVEVFLCYAKMDRMGKLKLADKYNLEILCDNIMDLFKNKDDFHNFYNLTQNFSDHTRSKLFQRFMYLVNCYSIQFK